MTTKKTATKKAPAKNAPTGTKLKQPLKKFDCIGTQHGKTIRETVLASDKETARKGFKEKHPGLTTHAVSEQ